MIYFDHRQQTFFDDNIHSEIPAHAVAIDQAQHQTLLAALNQGCIISDGLQISPPRPSAYHIWAGQAWTLPADAAAEQLAQAKTAKLAALNNAAQAYINRMAGIDMLPDFEVRTWTLQALEAKAWAADKTASTPTLDTIAAARSIPPDILKQKALEKALAFEQITATVVGLRQAVEDKINAAQTAEELEAVEFAFG